jgi:hypothetical protein
LIIVKWISLISHILKLLSIMYMDKKYLLVMPLAVHRISAFWGF